MSTIVGKNTLDVEIGIDYSALASPPTNQIGVIEFPSGVAASATSTSIQFIQSCIENGQPIKRLSNHIDKGFVTNYVQQNFQASNTQTGSIDFTGFVPLVNVNYNFAVERRDSQSFEPFRHNYVISGGTTVALTLNQFLTQMALLINADVLYNELTAVINSTNNNEMLFAGKAGKTDIVFAIILGTSFPTNLVFNTTAGSDIGVGNYTSVSEFEKYYKGYRGLQVNWVPSDYNGTTYYYAQNNLLTGVPTATATQGSTTITLTADQPGTYALRLGQTIVIAGNTYVVAKKTALVIELNIPFITATGAGQAVSMYVGYDTFIVQHRHEYFGLSEGNSNAPITSMAFVASNVAAPTAGSIALATLLGTTLNLQGTWR